MSRIDYSTYHCDSAEGFCAACRAREASELRRKSESECEKWAKESAEAVANWNALKPQIARLELQRDSALAANERDRTMLHRVIRQIDEEITGRMWLIEGRGSYEWDDDRFREEFAWAIRALGEKLEPLRKIAGDLKDCPTTQAAVDDARS